MPRSAKSGAKALQLLGRWTRLAQGHLPLGARCSCGAPIVNVRVADLERDVLDYLASRHAAARNASSVPELLRTIAVESQAEADELLSDLERSLASFQELHR
jgi:hypothetical protein